MLNTLTFHSSLCLRQRGSSLLNHMPSRCSFKIRQSCDLQLSKQHGAELLKASEDTASDRLLILFPLFQQREEFSLFKL